MHMRRRDSSRPTRLRNQRGLTAIELMVTLAILAILLGLAAPSMTRFIVQWRLSNTVNALTGSLRTARTEAIARARPVIVCQLRAGTTVGCETGTGARDFAVGWIVFVNNDRDAASAYSESAGDELLLRQSALPGIAKITLGKAADFVFLPNGLVSSGSNSVAVEAPGFDTLVTTPWARRTLCISKPGRIRHAADGVDCSGNDE
ncbi:prepilin-type N-terminal cleavage/methylation domain-containing protein [Variovorax paradoxus]|uniref:Type II secretion system protein H n=2 Tax=Variovorax paradoxus TaxID=34073 RepID=A0A5Q0M8B8_VARPD|nr:prepilin-type N-terminal cleavage/methylation domain-containing protein [Variovorax paradoxus]